MSPRWRFWRIARYGRLSRSFRSSHCRAVCGSCGACCRRVRRGAGCTVLRPRRFFVSVNWFLFVYAIQNNQTFEASLAYYISPIMAAVVGWVVFSERLKGLQWPAMVLALIAVAVLTVGLGHAPWLSLAMSASFIAYSGFKKGLEAGPTLAMAAETTLLVPLSPVLPHRGADLGMGRQ